MLYDNPTVKTIELIRVMDLEFVDAELREQARRLYLALCINSSRVVEDRKKPDPVGRKKEQLQILDDMEKLVDRHRNNVMQETR